MNEPASTAVTIGKWAMIISHVKNNRIEYLLCLGIAHILGLTTSAYSQVQGVCL